MRLIDANALFELLKEQREKETGAYSKGRNNGINVAIGAIRNEQICPTVDAVEVVHGRWDTVFYERNGTLASYSHICTKCKYFYRDVHFKGHNYCPNCGADMR